MRAGAVRRFPWTRLAVAAAAPPHITQFTCFTSTKLQILTRVVALALDAPICCSCCAAAYFYNSVSICTFVLVQQINL